MKIVLLCSDNPNQIALANKIANRFNLTGIVIETSKNKMKSLSFSKAREKILDRTLFYSIRKGWKNMSEYYGKVYPAFPEIEKIITAKINSPETIRFIEKLKPDLLMVSGTSIVKKEILNLVIPKGIINLHTGLSPYIKGAPNCTNWCIAKHKFHLIGNTVMWLDTGIDSGNIITTEQTILNGTESLKEVHIKVMEQAHELYSKAVEKIEKDFENCPNVKQASIAEGITYYTKDWNWIRKFFFIGNFLKMKKYLCSEKYKADLQIPIIIKL